MSRKTEDPWKSGIKCPARNDSSLESVTVTSYVLSPYSTIILGHARAHTHTKTHTERRYVPLLAMTYRRSLVASLCITVSGWWKEESGRVRPPIIYG